MLKRIGQEFGPAAASAVGLAAQHAGITNAAKFYLNSPKLDGDAVTAVSEVSSLGGGVLDTQRFILTQLRVLEVLNIVLTRLREAVDEETALEKLIKSNPALTPADVLMQE